MKNVLIFTLVVVFLVLSCKKDKTINKSKEITAEIEVDTLKVYNNILNYLLEKRLYYKCLGRNWELLYVDLSKKRIDSTTYLKKLNILRNDVVKNDSLKGILYVSGVFDGHTIGAEFLDFAEEHGFDLEEVKCQIERENRYDADSLKSNFVKLKKYRDQNSISQKKEFEVGSISFSKIVFKKSKNSGILYFSFVCGGKCGEGALALIEKTDGKWEVKKTEALWKS